LDDHDVGAGAFRGEFDRRVPDFVGIMKEDMPSFLADLRDRRALRKALLDPAPREQPTVGSRHENVEHDDGMN
jgi:hypothetical protein